MLTSKYDSNLTLWARRGCAAGTPPYLTAHAIRALFTRLGSPHGALAEVRRPTYILSEKTNIRVGGVGLMAHRICLDYYYYYYYYYDDYYYYYY